MPRNPAGSLEATIWDDQPVRWLESTVRFARYLESQGRPIDMSLVLSDNVRAATHRLIEETDEDMVRAFLAAWLAASSNRPKAAIDTRRYSVDDRHLLT
ncbi:MAG TPA: hypothetical protein P5279_13475 [Anaerohalosphaeraceae bacterium]|nr:hypothetical protein [Anaerohalosphaeraceae bacterium]HRT51500.1 hypothetical protein [Anaerohalosphaeraceae bacterium]HRT87165.1 hypothetical protein [Anaerohalosphaeraceae bacterium]